MIKAVLFDMDGVLINSVPSALRVRKKLLAAYGLTLDMIPDPLNEGHRATSLKTLLALIKSHHGIVIDHGEISQQAVRHVYRDLQEHGAFTDPKLIDFLHDLKENGIACAITSSGLREGIDNKLRILGIKPFFSHIITGSDVDNHKPHPEPYLRTMADLDVKPQHCVVFEDSMTGVGAARAAGCRTIVGFVKYNPTAAALSGSDATVHRWEDMNYDALLRIHRRGA